MNKTLHRIVAAASAAIGFSSLAHAQVSGTWINPLSGTWFNEANWSSNPLYPDGGGIATFAPNTWNTASVSLNGSSVTLSAVHLNGPAAYRISNGTLAFTGPAVFDVADTTGISPTGINPHRLNLTTVSTTAGLVKRGPGILQLDGQASQNYTGGTIIEGGELAFENDQSLGASGTSITLNGGTLRWQTPGPGTLTVAHPLVVGASGGTLFSGYIPPYFATSSVSAPITGSGTLTLKSQIIGPHVGGPPGAPVLSFNLSNAAGFSGTLNLQTAAAITGLGNAAALNLDDLLQIGAGGINDSATVTMRGGRLTNPGVQSDDVVSTVTLVNGICQLDRFVTPQIIRQNHATLDVGSDRLRITGTLPTMIGGGGAPGTPDVSIVPWMNFGAVSSVNVCTVDPASGVVRGLTDSEFINAVPSGVTTSNLKLTADATVNSPATVNSLFVNGSMTLGGSATLSVTSGAVFASATPQPSGNPSLSETLDAPLDFGPAEGIIRTPIVVSNPLTVNSPVSGSGGLMIAGYVKLHGNSTYTGPTTVSGVLYVDRDVAPGQPGPLGSDTSPVTLEAGSSLAGIVFTTGSTAFGRDIVSRPGGLAQISGTFGTQISGNLNVEGVLKLDNLTISGQISGSGRLITPNFVTLSGNNTFSGGVNSAGATLRLGSDTALGSGTFWMGGEIISVGGAHTLANPIVTQGGANFTGANAITFTGPVNLFGGSSTLNIGSLTTLNLTGQIFNGFLNKIGSGTLQVTNLRLPIFSTDLGTVRILPGGGTLGTSHVTLLGMNGVGPMPYGRFDITDHALIAESLGGFSPDLIVRSGYANGAWTGTGIVSSLADADHLGVGCAYNLFLGLSSFEGQPVSPKSFLFKLTYYGDSNLDGKVDMTDLGNLATNWQSTSGLWVRGDFNYDGFVNVTDLGLLASNWQAGVAGASLAPSRLDEALAAVGLSGLTVPEPASASLLVLGTSLLRRRRN